MLISVNKEIRFFFFLLDDNEEPKIMWTAGQ